MSSSTTAGTSSGYSIADIVGVVVEPQTYKNLLYLGLAFPLGMVYYVVLMAGFALGIGLSVLVVGLGILLGTVIGLRYIASVERRLANTLLGTAIATPDDVETAGKGVVGTAKAYLRASSTWRGLGFVILKFWLGILSFVLLVTFLGTAVELLLLPLFPGGALNVQVANWEVAKKRHDDHPAGSCRSRWGCPRSLRIAPLERLCQGERFDCVVPAGTQTDGCRRGDSVGRVRVT